MIASVPSWRSSRSAVDRSSAVSKRIEATSLSYIAFVNPIVAVLLGFVVAQEVLDPLVLAGAGMTLAGIWLATSKRVGAWIRVAMGAGVVTGDVPDPPEKDP